MAKEAKIEYAAVIGSGGFPWDMLRYDFCSPATEARDASELGRIEWALVEGRPLLEARAVVVKRCMGVGGDWTPARWKSQGWTWYGPFRYQEEAERRALEVLDSIRKQDEQRKAQSKEAR